MLCEVYRATILQEIVISKTLFELGQPDLRFSRMRQICEDHLC